MTQTLYVHMNKRNKKRFRLEIGPFYSIQNSNLLLGLTRSTSTKHSTPRYTKLFILFVFYQTHSLKGCFVFFLLPWKIDITRYKYMHIFISNYISLYIYVCVYVCAYVILKNYCILNKTKGIWQLIAMVSKVRSFNGKHTCRKKLIKSG
jgi:hypothetical protein